jgi:hypothetical protein
LRIKQTFVEREKRKRERRGRDESWRLADGGYSLTDWVVLAGPLPHPH